MALEIAAIFKIDVENKCKAQFEEHEKKFEEVENNVKSLNEVNGDLKNKIAECIDISSNQLKALNDSVLKSSIKMESLMNVYNDHIMILRQRFESILNDLNIIVSVQGGETPQNNKTTYRKPDAYGRGCSKTKR